jgi:hypothetical protein
MDVCVVPSIVDPRTKTHTSSTGIQGVQHRKACSLRKGKQTWSSSLTGPPSSTCSSSDHAGWLFQQRKEPPERVRWRSVRHLASSHAQQKGHFRNCIFLKLQRDSPLLWSRESPAHFLCSNAADPRLLALVRHCRRASHDDLHRTQAHLTPRTWRPTFGSGTLVRSFQRPPSRLGEETAQVASNQSKPAGPSHR